MSQIAELQAAVGEDGIRIAVEALKDIAGDKGEPPQHRLSAANALLSYCTYSEPQPVSF